jgi:carbamoyl-phosphate synthase large subunit
MPVTPEIVEQRIIENDIDAILLSFGGQTALNCGVALARSRGPRAPRRARCWARR